MNMGSFQPQTTDGIRYPRMDAYDVSTNPKGLVLLINIETFENGTKVQRHGSKRDYVMLKEMWEDFGYRVIEYYNLKQQEFQKAVTDFTSMPELENVDSAITFIMSHGKEDTTNPHGILVTASDDQFVSSDWIKNKFSAINCKALINKPKMLFFQACRGSLMDRGVRYNTQLNPGELALIEAKLVPVMSDLLIVYPTLPGYVSQRDTTLGALFVQECITVFTQDSPTKDLLSMLNKEKYDVALDLEGILCLAVRVLCRQLPQFKPLISQEPDNPEIDLRIQRKCLDSGSLFQVVYFESYGFNKKMYFYPKRADHKKKRGNRKGNECTRFHYQS